MSDWQPIDTAPRDGTEILIAVSGFGSEGPKYWVHIGWWQDFDDFPWRFIDTFDLTPTGCCDDESDDRVPANGAKEVSVHFWMPLPVAPTIAEQPA